MLKQFLPSVVETKLLYFDFLRTVPKDKIPEIHRKMGQQFDETQLDALMKKTGAASPAEFDAQLRKHGSSLVKLRRTFTEQYIAHMTIRKNVDMNPTITHEEIRDYYREHLVEYQVPAQVLWEEMMVRYDRFPRREDAWFALAAMGNEVIRGAKLDAVARRGSHGTTAEAGGTHPWTTRGSLVSDALDTALFSLPVGSLSRIIEGDRGYHIVRVTERREAGYVDFIEAQKAIKEILKKQKAEAEKDLYVEKLKKSTPVWTIFDEEGKSQIASPGSDSERR